MTRQVLLDHLGEVEAAALLVNGRLEDLLLDGVDVRPGAIYRAKADRPMKGQGGVFLSAPDGPLFLRQIKGLKQGETLLVQVNARPEPGKAPAVTQKVLFKSRYAIVTPDAPGLNISRQIKDEALRDTLLEIAHDAMEGSAMGLILRSSCAEADADDIADDVLAMRDLAQNVSQDTSGAPDLLVEGDGPHALAWREWQADEVITEPGSFAEHGVLEEIDALQRAKAGAMFIEPTRAFVAVDVNTGGDSSPAAGLKANLACARGLARQLRLRGLGGQIVVDFAPMPKKDRRAVESALRSAFRADPVETTLVGWTTMGHFELNRARLRVPLSEVL
ncbi:ribonuclease E/G [Primorskyibacter sp. S187A]|uniref:ribonuclease E/G n=1 Tax=Primorskyibacter sp. S187A TaxID=3415130 RepID=UPI003C7BD29F